MRAAILVNKDGYRYLQDYGLGPLDPWPRTKAMELGPRDRLSQAFWHEQQKGRTVATPQGPVVHLDLRHLGAKKIHERLPLITEVGEDLRRRRRGQGADSRVPGRALHNGRNPDHRALRNVVARPLRSRANVRASASTAPIGSARTRWLNCWCSGRVAGTGAADHAHAAPRHDETRMRKQAEASARRLSGMLATTGGERLATVREEMMDSMEAGVGIYRREATLAAACARIAELRARYRAGLQLDDRSRAFNTEWLTAIELGFTLEVAEAMAHSALERRESRGAHMRLDGYESRDDENFLKHTLAHHDGDGPPRIGHMPVNITRSPPRSRTYGGAGKKAEMS